MTRRHAAWATLWGCMAISGCASYSVADTPPQGFARLTFVPGEGKPLGPGYGGIRAVGKTLIHPGLDAVWVRPGTRSVGYACPGVIFMDRPPTLTHDFEPGARYELACDRGKGSIRRAE